MKHDIVFANEVHQACFGIFPPFFPRIGQQLFGIRDVADGRIKPHVQHLAFCSFYRYRNTPIQVASHGSWLQVDV